MLLSLLPKIRLSPGRRQLNDREFAPECNLVIRLVLAGNAISLPRTGLLPPKVRRNHARTRDAIESDQYDYQVSLLQPDPRQRTKTPNHAAPKQGELQFHHPLRGRGMGHSHINHVEIRGIR